MQIPKFYVLNLLVSTTAARNSWPSPLCSLEWAAARCMLMWPPAAVCMKQSHVSQQLQGPATLHILDQSTRPHE